MANNSLRLGALGAALWLSACGRHEAAIRGGEAAPPAGRLTLAPRMVADLKPAPATLTSRDLAEARARIGGTLTRLLVREGDLVRRGQVIAVIRDDRLGLQTDAYDAQVAAAQAEATRAQADLARTRDLFDHGVYAQARLDQVEAQAKAAGAALAAARAQRAASAELSGQGAVLAPADGRVLSADVPAGSVVMPGQTLVRITAGPMVVRIELPEAEATALSVGRTVALAPEDLDGLAVSGVITQVYPSVTAGEITADVTAATLPAGPVGRRVRAWVRVGERPALLIPPGYVAVRYGMDFVRLVRPDGSVSDSPVQTAPAADGGVEALSGLRAGDIIVPAGPAR